MRNSVIASLFVVIYLLTDMKVLAEEKAINFSVIPVLDERQTKGISGYFDLNVKDEKELDLYVIVKNMSSKRIKLDIAPTNALTVKNSGIQYTIENRTDYTYFTDSAYEMKEKIIVQKEIVFEANETKKIPVKVKIPQNKKGNVMGGLLFYHHEKEEKKQQTKENESFTIKNRYEYAMAIKLNIKESVIPQIRFGETKVEMLSSGAQLAVKMENDTAAIFIGNGAEYKITDKKGKTLFEGSLGEIKMAPKTGIRYPIYWNAKEIKNGLYTVHLFMTANNKKITYKKDFKIEKEEMRKYINKKEKSEESIIIKEKMPWWIWIVIVSVAVIFLFIGLKIRKK